MQKTLSYSEYLLGEILKLVDVDFQTQPYDIQFDLIKKHHISFESSTFNKPSEPLYECIENFIDEYLVIFKRESVYDALIVWSETFNGSLDEDLEEYADDDPESPENAIRNAASLWYEHPNYITAANWEFLKGNVQVMNEGRMQNDEPLIFLPVPAKLTIISQATELLKDIDGETCEEIIRSIGMEGQMLRQLFHKAKQEDLNFLYREKADLSKIEANIMYVLAGQGVISDYYEGDFESIAKRLSYSTDTALIEHNINDNMSFLLDVVNIYLDYTIISKEEAEKIKSYLKE